MTTPFRRSVVFGPPAAGKTTFVERHAEVGAVRWDYDAVLSAITGLPIHDYESPPIDLLLALRAAFVSHVRDESLLRDVWVIVSNAPQAGFVARLLEADLIEILPDHSTVHHPREVPCGE